MTRRTLARVFTGCLLAIGAAPAAHAQMQDAFVEPQISHDMQLFAPVDFDFEGLPLYEESGWFFNYNRLAWTATGERTTIGVRGLTDQSEVMYPNTPATEGVVPPTYTIENGIQDAPPNAEFGWGHRYEAGYFCGGNGWLVGVLEGPKVTSQETYGFQNLVIPNTLPLLNQGQVPLGATSQFLNFAPGLPPLLVNDLGQYPFSGGVGSADLSTTRNGFGSVHVNFETPPGFLLGFRDYQADLNGNGINDDPVSAGPGRVVQIGTVTAIITNGRVTSIQITAATTNQGADGVIDDLDGDGNIGFNIVFIDVDLDGVFGDGDILVAVGADNDDLHRFNIRFNTLTVRNTTETNGFELMRTHEMDNSHLPVKEQRNRFSFAYGARFFELDDNFSWDGDIDILGRTAQWTQAQNQIVGPQIRGRWLHQRNRFSFALDGRCLFGYNVTDTSQRGLLFEDALPGAVNRPVSAQPTATAIGRQDNEFSPVAELRAEGRYQLTSAFALKLGYTGIFVDNITRASQVVRYRLPDLGLLEGGQQDIFVNGVDFGVEAVY
ncbi:MAG TPA: BBP7 family outer membrane beta-barrel protein [Lacipirellulaceae bacterium]|nr:BBP7 family outer membrane beta-barrel protein [Lacipirellulaceae bacterium]